MSPSGKEALRVLIAGGGTGGHVIPALAVARELVAGHGAEVRFIGTARGLETRLVPAAGFPLELIEVGQLNQVSLATRMKTMAALPLGILDCVRRLRKLRPHVVLGVGGYASGPAMLAAILTRTPRVAFEPNAVPGMANRLVGRWVQAAAVNFSATARYFNNAQVTGVPVRGEFFKIAARAPGARPHLLVFGGSQGARVLNHFVPRIAAGLLDAIPGLTILHQCGARHYESTAQDYREQPGLADSHAGRWQLAPFLDDMAGSFAAASLVLCRSGASTVAELAAASKPALLVPFPLAADDHQRRNAEVLVSAGAAAMILEPELTAERLLEELLRLFAEPVELAAMSARARALAHPEAARDIAALVSEQRRA